MHLAWIGRFILATTPVAPAVVEIKLLCASGDKVRNSLIVKLSAIAAPAKETASAAVAIDFMNMIVKGLHTREAALIYRSL